MKGVDGGKYKQSEFVKIDPNDDYYLEHGSQICTPSYLSRLENNNVIAKEELINYFLSKLNARFIYRESNDRTQDYLCQCIVDLFFSPCGDISRIRNEIIKYSKVLKQDCLWELDLKAIACILNWFETGAPISYEDLRFLSDVFDCLNNKIKRILLHCFVFSVYFDPSLWSASMVVYKLIAKVNYNDEFLLSFLNSDYIMLNRLIGDDRREIDNGNNIGYRRIIVKRFIELFELAGRYGKIPNDELLDKLLSVYVTDNVQFKKSIQRVFKSKKFNEHDYNYLMKSFLIYEPYPFIVSKIINDHVIKIKK